MDSTTEIAWNKFWAADYPVKHFLFRYLQPIISATTPSFTLRTKKYADKKVQPDFHR